MLVEEQISRPTPLVGVIEVPLCEWLFGHLADVAFLLAVGWTIFVDVEPTGQNLALVEGVFGFGHHVGGLTTVRFVEVVIVGVVDVDVRDVLLCVLVPGWTLGEEVDVRKAVVLHRLFDDLFGLVGVHCRRAGDVGGPGGQAERERAKRLFGAAGWLGFRFVTFRARWRGLALGEAEDLVVKHDVGHIVVLAGGVHEVVATDPVAVTVATCGDDFDAWVGEFGCTRDWQRAAVNSVEPIAVEVAVELA